MIGIRLHHVSCCCEHFDSAVCLVQFILQFTDNMMRMLHVDFVFQLNDSLASFKELILKAVVVVFLSNVPPITDITQVFSRTVTSMAMVIDCVRMAALTIHGFASTSFPSTNACMTRMASIVCSRFICCSSHAQSPPPHRAGCILQPVRSAHGWIRCPTSATPDRSRRLPRVAPSCVTSSAASPLPES